MKVGTDGVLLGAWCSEPAGNEILDIGTGTALIALMLAQRFEHAFITAIEPNNEAAMDAELNVKNSPFRNRISIGRDDINHFVPSMKFDLIVSNPPFFSNSLSAQSEGRNQARHQRTFLPKQFAEASRWLSSSGTIAGIYPVDAFLEFEKHIGSSGLHLKRKTIVQPTPYKAAHRVLFEYSLKTSIPEITAPLVIEESGRHTYSESYRQLTAAFYLNM